jgi:hypothetical protein
MFKKLCFHWFSNLLNLGYVVEIPEDHTVSRMDGAWVWLGDGTQHLAESQFRDAIKDKPLGKWLQQHRPHHMTMRLHTDWGHYNMLDWYQHPRYRVELASVRFFHAGDAVNFKLAFL